MLIELKDSLSHKQSYFDFIKQRNMKKSSAQAFKQYSILWLAILAFTILMLTWQLASKAVLITKYSDTIFHFGRFYDAAQQIKTGNFNWFLMNYSFDQSGRIVNALYGPAFAYLQGYLVLICKTWFRYQIVTDLLLNLLAGTGFYQLAKECQLNQALAVILSLFYLTIGYLPGWLLYDNMMAWGAALAPFVIKQGVRMVVNQKRPINWFKLMLTMSLVAQVHLLSLLLLAAALIPFAIVGLTKTSSKKDMIKELLLAIGGTLLLTVDIWGSFLVVYPGNHIATPAVSNMYKQALTFGVNNIRTHISFAWFAIILLQTIASIINFKHSALNNLLTLEGLFFLICASRILPWKEIQNKYPALASSFQFPHRFVVIAYPLLLLAVGLTCRQFIKSSRKQYLAKTIILSGAILLTVSSLIPVMQTERNSVLSYQGQPTGKDALSAKFFMRWRLDSHSRDLNKIFKYNHVLARDYLPMHHHGEQKLSIYKDVNYQIVQRNYLFSKKILNQKQLIVSWLSSRRGTTQLPIVLYHRSQLVLNKRPAKIVKLSKIGSPTVKQRKGSNEAILSYTVPIWFKILLLISSFSWIIAILIIPRYH